MLSAFTQLGFLLGPVCGSAIMQAASFQVMSIALGALMVLASPLMLINRALPNPEDVANRTALMELKVKGGEEVDETASAEGGGRYGSMGETQ